MRKAVPLAFTYLLEFERLYMLQMIKELGV
jgi:hypothetical protein